MTSSSDTDAELPSAKTNLTGHQVNLKKRNVVLMDKQGGLKKAHD
jgi:hypothetical protein